MQLYFNHCRVCGQAHAVGEPHKFGKAADVRRNASVLSAEAIETLASAFDDVSAGDTPRPPVGPSVRPRGRPKKIK